ncbi:AraC family transcriptional regulator [Mucilaginibacter sp. PAMB04274]
MVCDRCIMVVRQQLESLGLSVDAITLGTANIHPDPDESQLSHLTSMLKVSGFELINKEKDKLIERIKNVVIEIVHQGDLSEIQGNIMTSIADRLCKDYAYLSRLFSESEDTTIEKFIIQQKIEKVKELIQYGELNITEIAYSMGYSSSAHLSAQFKSVTGMSPRQYKSCGDPSRKSLDKV